VNLAATLVRASKQFCLHRHLCQPSGEAKERQHAPPPAAGEAVVSSVAYPHVADAT
jgi:hypothetical protein